MEHESVENHKETEPSETQADIPEDLEETCKKYGLECTAAPARSIGWNAQLHVGSARVSIAPTHPCFLLTLSARNESEIVSNYDDWSHGYALLLLCYTVYIFSKIGWNKGHSIDYRAWSNKTYWDGSFRIRLIYAFLY